MLRCRPVSLPSSEQIFIGGESYLATQTFQAWVAGYDGGGHGTRSQRRHGTWIKELNCQLARLVAADYSVQHWLEPVMSALDHSIRA